MPLKEIIIAQRASLKCDPSQCIVLTAHNLDCGFVTEQAIDTQY